jgi:hypothetical protein
LTRWPVDVVILAVPAIVAMVLYFPSLPGGFISDDYTMLFGAHEASASGDTIARVARTFLTGLATGSHQYRPLTIASFAASYAVSGIDASGWRLVNVVLHGLNAALVSLLAAQLLGEHTRRNAGAAMAAGLLFAAFPPSVEAVAWIAGRFDGLTLFFTLLSACAFVRCRDWSDRFGVMSLAAAVCAFLSKEAAAILPVLILALAAWKQFQPGKRLAQALIETLRRAVPWFILTLGYFILRRWLFGDPFSFIPGSSPWRTLVSGEWLENVQSLGPWWPRAMPESVLRQTMVAALLALAVLAVVVGERDRRLGRVLAVSAFATAGAVVMLLLQLAWLPNGEGGRAFYEVWAIASIGLAIPIAAGPPRWVALASGLAAVVFLAEISMTHAAIERRTAAGRDMKALAAAVAQIAENSDPGGYAFILLPDRVGAIPFGRGSQDGLLSPPIQTRSLSDRVIVQTTYDLPAWPELLRSGIVGRLQHEPLADVAAHPMAAPVSPPYVLPNRYYCFNARSHTLVELSLDFEPDLSDWATRWNSARSVAGCDGNERGPAER